MKKKLTMPLALIVLFILTMVVTSNKQMVLDILNYNEEVSAFAEMDESVEDEEEISPSVEQMKSICKLATSECYYHNIAKYYKKDAEGMLFWKKDKKFWVEYSGVITIGVDVTHMKVQTDKNIINIYLPEASIISSKIEFDDIDEDSVYIDNKSAKVNQDDITSLYEQSEQEMLDSVKNDQNILTDAQNKAKSLITSYINNLEEVTNTTYRIKWVTADYFTPSKDSSEPKKEYKKVLNKQEVILEKGLNIIDVEYEWDKENKKREKTDMIVLHHSASSSCTVESIHRSHQSNGWGGIGYHYFIDKDGTIYSGRPEWAIGSHAKGSNLTSIGICLEGNYEMEFIPDAQRESAKKLINYLQHKYNISEIKKHSDVRSTLCPGKNFNII